jgi:transcriptional regulator with XRE-family HTH domain
LSSKHQQAREALGARLRELRRASGLNGKEFATKLGWYGASRVSKLELGQQTPSEQDLVAWTRACNKPEALGELRIQLNAVETFYNEWRRQLYGGVHARQSGLIELDTEITNFRVFESWAIPGLLQTPEYAYCHFEYGAKLHRVPQEVDEAVRLRMQRQNILHTQGKQFHFVLTEAALRYHSASYEVTPGQLEKLQIASTLRSVKLGVIPFSTPIEIGARHGFWIYDDRMIIIETFAAELRLTQPGEIDLYSRVFELMTKAAVYGDQARRLISYIARTLPPPADTLRT